PLLGLLGDGHRRVRAEPAAAADDVDVEQDVADDHQRSGHGLTPRASSITPHSRWTAARWISWTVVVAAASTVTASSHASVSGFGLCCYVPHATTPPSLAV